ncbi:MAG: 16S rRNA (guanine(966)-N(2))-methyltransferase RsmD [Myxococcaceae bacterium]
MAGSLRITGGALVRQHFAVPKEADSNLVRPASDRVREAIFSSLSTFVQDATVLDLFSGSGAYVFESLSRGAKSAILIEKSPDTFGCIKANIQKLKLDAQCKLIKDDALRFVQQAPQKFDLIFVDPPYTLKLTESFWVDLKAWATPDSMIIFRCKSQADFICPVGYEITRERTYGGTWVAFIKIHIQQAKDAC